MAEAFFFELSPLQGAILCLLGLLIVGFTVAILMYFLTRKSGGDQ
jgi:hypothetical protein